jgi:hypothetical protein
MVPDISSASAPSGGINSGSQYFETLDCRVKKENTKVNMKTNTKLHAKMNRNMKENINECHFGHECGDVWKEEYGFLTRR